MSVHLEARFDSDGKANLAVEQLRQSGIIFELLELKPLASRWKEPGVETNNRALNAVFPQIPEGAVATYPSGMPFEHICAHAYMATNSAADTPHKSAADIHLRISVSEKSLGKAEKIIRNAHGYGLKMSH